MNLVVVEITVTDKEISIVRIPEGQENTFCTGIRQSYPLSENVKINIKCKSENLSINKDDNFTDLKINVIEIMDEEI